jgi:hypothetical protein
MVKVSENEASSARERRAAWVDRRIKPLLGPSPLGPWEETGSLSITCPVCGRFMSEHTMDRSHRNSVLMCPAEHRPDPRFESDAPLNEVGMPKRSR